jgi:hypothetical protein
MNGSGTARTTPKSDEYDEKEAQRGFEGALKGALLTSPKPLKEKPKGKNKEAEAH